MTGNYITSSGRSDLSDQTFTELVSSFPSDSEFHPGSIIHAQFNTLKLILLFLNFLLLCVQYFSTDTRDYTRILYDILMHPELLSWFSVSGSQHQFHQMLNFTMFMIVVSFTGSTLNWIDLNNGTLDLFLLARSISTSVFFDTLYKAL